MPDPAPLPELALGRPTAEVPTETGAPRLCPGAEPGPLPPADVAGLEPLLAPPELERFGRGEALVYDGVLGAPVARAVAAGIRAHGFRLQPASVGRQTLRQHDANLRGDATCWLEPRVPPALAPLWDLFERLAQRLRSEAWLGPLELEVQLARYPHLSMGYARHRDAFVGRTRRRATAIWYLDESRTPTDGGELRTFGPAGPQDLDPRFDRLVLFDSARLEHAVLPCRVPRWAVTVWFLGPERP